MVFYINKYHKERNSIHRFYPSLSCRRRPCLLPDRPVKDDRTGGREPERRLCVKFSLSSAALLCGRSLEKRAIDP